jgi:AraC-like DNA-binding protein
MNSTIYSDLHQNAIRFSAYRNYQGHTDFEEVAAKYVLSGRETYYIHGRKYVVNEGEYVIGSGLQHADVTIETETVGICVDISIALMEDIAQHHPNAVAPRKPLSEYLLVNKYNRRNSLLGGRLHDLATGISHFGANQFTCTDALLHRLGESILFDQLAISGQLAQLPFKKKISAEEVFRKLHTVKSYIDDCFLEDVDTDTLCAMACMSKYAFVRHFREAFGTPPYRYLLQRRLEHACGLLRRGVSVQDVAHMVRFADTPSFTKAFKARHGVAPSCFRK